MPIESFISVKNHHSASRNNTKSKAVTGNRYISSREINSAPLISRLLDGIADGEPVEALALLTHTAIARIAIDVATGLATKTGIRTVALSGGVFMNRLLLSDIRHGLEQRDLTVLLPHDVPFNDGCIAYGQAAIARAQLSRQP